MTKTIAVAQQKGGTGKTTTASALAAGLAAMRRGKVLLIDLDAQSNLTFIHGGKTDGLTALELLEDDSITAAMAAQPAGEKLDLIASTEYLAGADGRLKGKDRALILKGKLAQLDGQYSYIVIDTPPALGLLTINAFMAADSVVIPCLADVFSIQATTALARTLDTARQNGNSSLKVEGILVTRYSQRQIITRDTVTLLEQAAQQMKTKVFKARIRDSVAVREAQALQTDLFKYAPLSTSAQDYKAFVKELLAGWQTKRR